MGFKITSSYHWYLIPKEPPVIIKAYFIEGIPFDFDYMDNIEDLHNDRPDILSEAERNKGIHADDMFKKSDYLIAEMMHPLLFDLELDNPEELPQENNN
jgi:hypothetical protein